MRGVEEKSQGGAKLGSNCHRSLHEAGPTLPVPACMTVTQHDSIMLLLHLVSVGANFISVAGVGVGCESGSIFPRSLHTAPRTAVRTSVSASANELS